ncbi:hypothetical protein MAPG_01412 [Magnaporthiopsis poae ATCC 64411]|uniref:Uncharacterized protein n=1 Tax=Magnaporthiopsis poae (strain ATCC 64411 / 73-15) TaxID=644358 RepID=A0A0C4DNM0_MAGP6|nr:hypothetical protein MAPG_01412 [Magnaporthiopsis poae ATCC 64411]
MLSAAPLTTCDVTSTKRTLRCPMTSDKVREATGLPVDRGGRGARSPSSRIEQTTPPWHTPSCYRPRRCPGSAAPLNLWIRRRPARSSDSRPWTVFDRAGGGHEWKWIVALNTNGMELRCSNSACSLDRSAFLDSVDA